MNKSILIGSIIIGISIIVASGLHGYITTDTYQIALGGDLTSTALVSNKTGQVWFISDKSNLLDFRDIFQAWYGVPDMEWKK